MTNVIHTATFRYFGKVYSVTRMAPNSVVFASRCLNGKRLRGRPASFTLAPGEILRVRPIVCGKRR